jgi:GNAT superfamily N-acetyltransferase
LIPGQVYSGPAIKHFIEGQPARAQMRAWAAKSGSEIVGWAHARVRWSIAGDDIAGAWVGVTPEHRRAGLGSRLYELLDEHIRSLGARRWTSFVKRSLR